MKNLALFDLDGTLTDPKEGITKSIAYALKHFSIEINNLDELTKFIGPPLRDSFCEFYGFSEDKTEEAVSKYREYFSEKGIYQNALYPGTLDMLGELRKRNITMLIATSKPTVYAIKIAEHFKFIQYFDFIAGSELDGRRSNKREVIDYALNSIGCTQKKDAILMIGDRKHDIIGAKEIGIDSIGVTWGYGSQKELLDAGATWVVNSWEEIVKIAVS
ncbi:MAG: HAD family hydrolase [Defluviitaleaceae bacterium]|nr:HAD family hydrolase [Defluviitaleaceae bacterium]